MMKKKLLNAFILFLLPLCTTHAITANEDTLLKVLREELAADMAELQQQEQKPYWMSFFVEDSHIASVIATFGSLGNSGQEHTRTFMPQIRIGSPEIDNFKSNNTNQPLPTAQLPLADASPDAIRAAIWQATVNAYFRSEEAYRGVSDRLRRMTQDEDKAPSFSMAPKEEYYEAPLPHPTLTPEERKEWEQRLCRVSAVFRQWKHFNSAQARLEVETRRTYLVNTEGTSVVQNRQHFRLLILGETNAEDGMKLPLVKTYFATQLDSLPSEEQLCADVEDIGRRLIALEKAPIAEPFTGPAIMSGEASGVFFHEIFGHRIEGHRMKSGGQTFRNMIGTKVLPDDFQVYCDPTLTRYGKQLLNGGYHYDEEGVKARRVNNVVDGILKEFLMSRIPLDSFPQSNGHGRAARGRNAVSRQSNLVVETRHPYSESTLRQMLRDEARKQGKPYGYLFQSVTGGYTDTGDRGGINSFNITPLEVYRIYADGRPDELVRGVDLIGTPLTMFSHIQAGGDTPSTFIGMCGAESGWVPVSATSPMLFVATIETQRRQQTNTLKPLLEAPSFSAFNYSPINQLTNAQRDSIVFQALETEMKRSLDSLRMENQPAPFLIDYRLQRRRGLKIQAQLGETITSQLTPWEQWMATDILIGSHQCTDLSGPNPDNRGKSIPMSTDIDNLRRYAWTMTNDNYKSALTAYERKCQEIKKITLEEDEKELPDLLKFAPATSIEHRSEAEETYPIDKLENYVKRLSRIAYEYPKLTRSSASIDARQCDQYRTTSEGIRVCQPQDFINLSFHYLLHFNAGGYEYGTAFERKYKCVEDMLADSTSYIEGLRHHISVSLQKEELPANEEYYIGPLLIEKGACERIFQTSLVKLISTERNFLGSNRNNYAKLSRKVVDEKISLWQDPTISQWEGKKLFGHYKADANGQAPQAIKLIENGIFKAQLCGRSPSLGTSSATGNYRFYNYSVWNSPMGIGTTPSVLRLQSNKTMSLAKMKKLLLRKAQREGYDHAYILRSFNELIRIGVKDEKEELVRNENIKIPDYLLRHIVALSTEEEATQNSLIGSDLFSIIGPKAMLLNDVEMPISSVPTKKEPVLTFPLARTKKQ